MEYSSYSFSAATHAEFYKAEAELLRFGDRLTHSPCAKYMKSTLLAIDAVFAIRMSHDVVLPVVPLITAYDLTDWKYNGDTTRSVMSKRPEFRFSEEHRLYRERWALYNARNTYMSVIISDSFLAAADCLRTKWRSQDLQIPANSALDKLLDLFLAVPGLSTIRASKVIGKSYGATNEAMRQLVKAGIVREVALDGRERVFICEQSAAMITEFVDNLIKMGEKASANDLKYRD